MDPRLGLMMSIALICIVGCGAAPESQTLPTPEARAVAEPFVEGAPNAPPEIVSIQLSPTNPRPGEQLKAAVRTRDAEGSSVSVAYEWEARGKRILAEGPIISVPELQRGDRITVRVIADDGQSLSEPRTASASIANRPPRILSLDFDVDEIDGGKGRKIRRWRARPKAVDPDGDRIDFEYTWVLNGRATRNHRDTQTSADLRRGDRLSLTVTAQDGEGRSKPLESAALVMGNAAPDILSQPPGLDHSGVFRYTPEVDDPDGDQRFSFTLTRGPEGMEIDDKDGTLTWKPTARQAGSHPVKLTVADDHGGKTTQGFALKVAVGAAPAAAR